MVPSHNFLQELMTVDKICDGGGGGMTTTITTTLPKIHLHFVEYTDYCAACKTHHHHLDRVKHAVQLVDSKMRIFILCTNHKVRKVFQCK